MEHILHHLAILFLLVVFSVSEHVNGQEKITLGTSQEDLAHSLKMYQGKYYIVGTTRKDKKSARDYYLIELRSDGTVENETVFGFPRHDAGSQVWVDEQGIFVAGSAYDWGFPNVDMHLFKLSENGLPEWERFYGTEYQDQGLNLIRTRDGGFALIGYSNTQLDGGDFYFVKTDGEGNPEWEKFFGPPYVDYGFSLVENDRGEFVLAGAQNGFYNPTQTDFTTHDAQILIVKTNEQGDLIWSVTFGGTSHDWAKDIVQAPGGGYLVCGSTQSSGSGSFDIFLMKIDEEGNQLWMKTFGGQDFEYGEKLQAGADGNIYISGTSASFSASGKPDHYIIKADPEGNEIWTKVLGGEESDYSSGLAATPDSGVVFTGWVNPGPTGNSDIVFYKLSKDGEPKLISGIYPGESVTQILVYPNPAREQFSVEVVSLRNQDFIFSLMDSSGKRVARKKLDSNAITEIKTKLKAGMYFYQVEAEGNNIQSGKLVIKY